MSSYKGLAYLRNKLAAKRSRVLLRYKFYDMKNYVKDLGISTPPELRSWTSCLGWCAKGVDSLADRLVFRGFDNDNFEIQEIFDRNNPDIMADSAILGALISACDFIYISPDADGYPRFQVIDGGNATGVIDPITNMLTEGYAVLERSDSGQPTLEAYFTSEFTQYIQGSKTITATNHKIGYALLVPVIYRPDAKRPFGHSRISRAAMDHVEGAIRTVKRSEVAAEFYSFPQKWATNLSEDFEEMDTYQRWRSAMSAMMTFTKDEDGEHPVVGQFSQQSMEPHLAQVRMFASLFAGEMGLTLDDIGFSTGNPASADAIKASHDNLRLTARKAQRCFGSAFLNAGYLAACLRDKYVFKREQFYLTQPQWEPIFEPDAAMLSGLGDAIYKINQAVPGYIGTEGMRKLTGIEADNGGRTSDAGTV